LLPILLPITIYILLGIKSQKAITIVFSIIVILLNLVGYYYVVKRNGGIPPGPFTKEAQEIFRYIKKLPANSVIIFEEPACLQEDKA